MKQLTAALLTAALALTMTACRTQAAGARRGMGPYCVDNNHDGICDYIGSSCHTDRNADGVCDYCGAACETGCVYDHQCGQYYLDLDGDGTCDHYQDGHGCGAGHGSGCHSGGHGGHHRGGHC